MHYQILQQVPALLLNYRQTTSLSAPFLGDYDLYQHKFNETFIIRKVVNTSEYTPEELGVLDKLLVLPHPNLLKVLGYEKLDNDSFQIFFEGIEGSLQDDISSRSKLSKNYTDRELLEMLKKFTEVLVYLEKFQIPHKQITLDSIFITSKGEPKLVHPLMVGSRVPTYHKLLQKMQNVDMKYLPSEAVSCLMERKIFPDTDPYKEDIYSLGMCFLEAARVNAKVEQSSLSKSAKLDDTKGVKIMPIIAKMLDENPQRRVDASLLTQMLSLSQDMNDYSPSKLKRYDENDCASPVNFLHYLD